MVPDRVIARKIRQYDSYLYLKWNNEKQYFELWRRGVWNHQLITPVTQSIYTAGAPIVYAPLDERLLWWIHGADSWKTSPKDHALESDNRWIEFNKQSDIARRNKFYDYGKDMWAAGNAFYASRYASKNDGPKFNQAKRSNWSKPDVQSKTSKNVFYRSNSNAKGYNFQK